ncbi:MAG: amino acid-binding protein [Actinomycetota bacterium]|nr:amino acid-binding protein [Actinomycetota bacterium]
MTYLLRLVLPDRPGSLGAVASAIGAAGGDIVSLDVVERGADGAVDDLIVELTPGRLADSLITASRSVPGVIVESLRPYPSGRDLHRDLELVDELAGSAESSLALLTDNAPGVFRAGWALCMKTDGMNVPGGAVTVLHASAGAPDPSGISFPWLPLTSARRMGHHEDWVPDRWDVLGMELAAAPVGRPDRDVLVGRPGGPRFRASEVLRLAHLAGIAATVGQLTAVAGLR